MRAALIFVAVLLGASFAVGCSQTTSPTVPTAATPLQQSGGAVTNATFHPETLVDSSLDGSAYQLDGVSGTLLSFSNAQNTYSIAFDTETKFRRAVLQSWNPSDAYYQAALAYNTIATSDGSTLIALVGGHVRIVLVPPNPIIPTDPYRIQSFQPIP